MLEKKKTKKTEMDEKSNDKLLAEIEFTLQRGSKKWKRLSKIIEKSSTGDYIVKPKNQLPNMLRQNWFAKWG